MVPVPLSFKIIVRKTGDNPLVDFKIVDNFIRKFKKKKPDYLSNCVPWTYPDGYSVEVFSYDLLKRVEKKANANQRKEGSVIIRYLIDNWNTVKSVNIPCPVKKIPKFRVTLDEQIDFDIIKKVYEHFKPNIYFGFKELVFFVKKNKKFFKKNKKLIQNYSFVIKKENFWK